jgi:peptidylprolyl isomerase
MNHATIRTARAFALLIAAVAMLPHVAPAKVGDKPLPSASDILNKAPADAWARIADDDLMLIDLADGRRVTIWLASAFAPVHIANMRIIARAGWWNDATIYRVQDNYVTQWGDATEKKPPAPGIDPAPPAEYDWPATAHPITPNRYSDAYASQTGFTADGWAVAGDGTRQWLPHCYAMVGVARNLAPDTGTGGDLYTVIGHAPRHLDRNIALVGRVIDGMQNMSALPRGTGGGLGLYEDARQYVPIKRVVIASDLPAAERPAFQYFRPGTPDFAAYMDARANRAPPFFTVPANAADLCNLPVPVRKVAAAK